MLKYIRFIPRIGIKEAYEALSIFMDEFLGDFHEKILKIFKMYFLKG